MKLLLTGGEWSELGSRDIDGKAERPSEREQTSQWIGELGIYDYRHRMYHPMLGRFLQMDPTGFDAGDMNVFRYCADDPVDRIDPTGLVDKNPYSPLTMFGGGDWIKGSDGLSAWDWNHKPKLEAGPEGGGGEGADSAGHGAAFGIRREATNPRVETIVRNGNVVGYINHIRWMLTPVDKNGQPCAPNTRIQEDFEAPINPVDYQPKRVEQQNNKTNAAGTAVDKWNHPFTSAKGQVTLRQIITMGDLKATLDATITANPRTPISGDTQYWAPFVPR